MKINSKYFSILSLLLLIVINSHAQKKVENIGSEVVNVVKPYTATLSDAFKIKEIPKLNDTEISKKLPVQYNIFSFPVASTFSPAKGTASQLDATKEDLLYKNYLSIGLGTYNAANVDFFANHNIADNQIIGLMLQHKSSQGGIKNMDLKNYFYETNVDLGYQNFQESYSFKTNIGFENKVYNWYGLPLDFGINLMPNDKQNLINSIHPEHSYNEINANGNVIFNDNLFKEIGVNWKRFSDNYGSQENRFILKPSFEIAINDKIIKTNINVDYVGGSFKNTFNTAQYSYVNIGINPNYVLNQEDLSINLGVNLVMSAENTNAKNKFFVYPKIKASYKVVGDYMIAFAGLEGNLNQNSYRDFVSENPFVSPDLFIAPTDLQYNLSAGIKGKLSDVMAYSINGFYVNEKNKVLFRSNNFTETLGNSNFGFGNSFQIVYDNVITTGLQGELKAMFSKNIDASISGSFSTFNNQFEQQVWNLPQLQLQSTINVVISEKWFCGFNLFYVGQRKDFQSNLNNFTANDIKTLEGYFDLNSNVGYNYSKRLTAFLKANNIANQGYQKWLNFPVQQFQLVLGAAYKFDF